MLQMKPAYLSVLASVEEPEPRENAPALAELEQPATGGAQARTALRAPHTGTTRLP